MYEHQTIDTPQFDLIWYVKIKIAFFYKILSRNKKKKKKKKKKKVKLLK
jgi:hypothetical protein